MVSRNLPDVNESKAVSEDLPLLVALVVGDALVAVRGGVERTLLAHGLIHHDFNLRKDRKLAQRINIIFCAQITCLSFSM